MNVLQIHPTLKCNLNCDWCFYTKSDSELSLSHILTEIKRAKLSGCEILKISGGGEPTMYSRLVEVLYYAKTLQFKIFLQTNGTNLDLEIRRLCDDIRISYGDNRPFKESRTVIPDGFSYIVSAKLDYENLNNLLGYAIPNGFYVRITQDDTDIDNVPTISEIQRNINSDNSFMIKSGSIEINRLSPGTSQIRFWDALNYKQGRNPCPCFESPLLGADGYWYPCCKTHCAKDLTRGYNTAMRIEGPYIKYDGSDCARCYYS